MRINIFGSAVLFACYLASPTLMAEDGANLISNPGFEDGPNTFSLFTPAEAKDANCRFTISTDVFHTGKQSALMQSDDFARFAVGPDTDFPVSPGECYRIEVWVKAGTDFQTQSDGPGVALRLKLTAGSSAAPAASGLMFIYLDNTVSQAAAPDYSPLSVTASAPTQWTHMTAVVKVPAGVDSIGSELFFWRAKGSLYVDDFSIQKVDPSTPVTPLQAAPK